MSKYILSAKQIGIEIQAWRSIRMFSSASGVKVSSITLEALCKKAGMTKTNWKERERGKMDMRLSTLFRMLAALKVTPQKFFEGLGR